MAYILKRKWKTKVTYRVQVSRRVFKNIMKTFQTRTEAKKWGRAMERKLDVGDYSDYTEVSTLSDLIFLFLSLLFSAFISKKSLYSDSRRSLALD